MTPAATTLPPPLSDAPSVETLERLLDGLHQPMHRGVPRPPAAERSLDLTVLEPAPSRGPVEAPAASPPSLSWSAGNHRRGAASSTTALGVAIATAAGVLAGLVALGEVPLP